MVPTSFGTSRFAGSCGQRIGELLVTDEDRCFRVVDDGPSPSPTKPLASWFARPTSSPAVTVDPSVSMSAVHDPSASASLQNPVSVMSGTEVESDGGSDPWNVDIGHEPRSQLGWHNPVMQIVVCEGDPLLREMIEAVVARTGHQVAGSADSTAGAVALIDAVHPDAVIVDLSLGNNSDFDVIATAIGVQAKTVVFSHNIDTTVLDGYSVSPAVVIKPDLGALEDLLGRMATTGPADDATQRDRRQSPARRAVGPMPTGVVDAQAFFEAVNGAEAGDGMLSLEVAVEAEAVARDATRLMRDTDRLLAFPSAVRLYLPGSGEIGIRSLLGRIVSAGAVPPGCRVTSVVVREGEEGADAFARLKADGDVQVPEPTETGRGHRT